MNRNSIKNQKIYDKHKKNLKMFRIFFFSLQPKTTSSRDDYFLVVKFSPKKQTFFAKCI